MSTLISWSDEVWNPTTGCDRVSPGCANCYALHLAARYRRNPRMQELGIYQKDGGKASGPGFGLTLRPEVLQKPLHWRKPKRIFVNSMSDLFHEEVPDEYIAAVFGVMARAKQHTFQILTKRIERAASWLNDSDGATSLACLAVEAPECFDVPLGAAEAIILRWPLTNVLIGPTVENEAMAQKRLPVLREIHALGWRTMVSNEPALGPVDFSPWLMPKGGRCTCGRTAIHPDDCGVWQPSIIDWLICGGESGSGRRPFDHAWARSALTQARAAGVPFFMKQDGAYKSEVYESLPEDLRVREFPEQVR